MGCFLDKNQNGIITINEIGLAIKEPLAYKPFIPKEVVVEEKLAESICETLDFFRPLAIMFMKYGKHPDKVFEQFDKNPKNYLLSTQETAALIKRYLGLKDELLESEV